MTIITIIAVAAISAMFGFAICAVVSQGTINEERGEMPNEPTSRWDCRGNRRSGGGI